MGNTENRKRRIEIIKNNILKVIERDKVVSYEKMIAFCMYNFGISRRDARDEINAVIAFEELKKEGDFIK
ncbi:MAG: hypothetical protein ACOCT9_00605 [archaeon]